MACHNHATPLRPLSQPPGTRALAPRIGGDITQRHGWSVIVIMTHCSVQYDSTALVAITPAFGQLYGRTSGRNAMQQ